MSPFPPSIDIKDYLDSRFDGLEKLIDAKFQAVEEVVEKQNKALERLECRVSSLEKWRAYILGACALIGFLANWVWGKIS